jgi:hypothetical protein
VVGHGDQLRRSDQANNAHASSASTTTSAAPTNT